MFLKSKGFLRNTGHWKSHGFETFSGFEKFEKRDNIARESARNRLATKVIFFKICAHYGKNAPLRARREQRQPSQPGTIMSSFVPKSQLNLEMAT